MSDGMLCKTNVLVSFIRPVMRKPCTTFVAGLLVMKSFSGKRWLEESARAERMVDIESWSLHSSKASMMMMHGGNDSSHMATPRGSTMSFFSCLDGRAYCTSGSLHIASDTCFLNMGLNDES